MQWSVVGEVTAVNVGLGLREEEREKEEGEREGGREERMVGRKGSSDRHQKEKKVDMFLLP